MLLDSHVLLWWFQGNKKLSLAARTSIGTASTIFVSSVAIWEIGIKVSIGKLDVDMVDLLDDVARSGFIELPISHRHAAKVRELPHLHRDPFDRMLIAQAMCESMRLMSADALLARYSTLVDII